jgi:hypothetical protein
MGEARRTPWTWLRDQLYGRSRPAGGPHRPGRRPFPIFALLAGLPFLVGTLAYLLIVVVVDPYDIRPWGLAPHIADHRYPDTEWPLLIKVVTEGGYDTVLVGASTVMGVTSEQMRRAFGPDIRPVNLAYPLSTPDDMGETLRRVTAMPRLKHVIVVIDHSQMLPLGVANFPSRRRDSVLASDWAHAGDFSIVAAEGSMNRVLYGVYDTPRWAAMDRPGFIKKSDSIATDQRISRRMNRAVVRYGKAVLGSPETVDCRTYPFPDKVLHPALRRLVDRGVQVDLLFPPYLLASYYDWIERRMSNDAFAPGPVFPQMIAFKRCILQSVADFGDTVRVTAVDNDTSITGALDNYADPVHLLRPRAYQAMLDHIAAGDSHLTLASLPDYEARLAQNLLAVHVTPADERPPLTAAGGPPSPR